MARYWALRLLSAIWKVSSALLAISSVGAFLFGLWLSAQTGRILTDVDRFYAIFAPLGVAANCFILMSGLSSALGLYAAAHFVDAIMDIEWNTRGLRGAIRRGAGDPPEWRRDPNEGWEANPPQGVRVPNWAAEPSRLHDQREDAIT